MIPGQPRVAGFTQVGFSARIDSKGRVTVPARIRNRLDLEKGDKLRLSLKSSKILKKKFSNKSDALEFLSRLEGVEEFSFQSGVLEVVISE